MKPWKALLCGLGLSGLFLFGAAGCGGGDVPDAGADDLAAFDEAPAEPALPAPPPAQAEAAVEPAAPGAPEAPAAPAAAESDLGAEPAEPAALAPGLEAPAAKSEANSATAEMLALATSAAPPSAAPVEVEDAPPGEQDASLLFPTDPSGEMGQQLGASSLMPGAGGLMPGEGYGGGGFGPGGDQNNEPADTTSPDGAVEAFLNALKAKDRDQLVEATALRAVSTMEGGSHRELFSRIFDYSISDAELDDLAARFEGFEVAGFNQVKSTGRLGVTVRKQDEDGGWLQRTITVRKEKKGWGVLDISSQTKFDAGPMRGRGAGRGGR